MLLDLFVFYMFGSTLYVTIMLLIALFRALGKTEKPEPLTRAAPTPGAAPQELSPEAAPDSLAEEETVPAEGLETVELRTQALADSLRRSAAALNDRELAKTLEQLAVTLELLAHNAQIDARDIPATLRFLERYGAPLDKLVDAYAGMERAHGATPAMRKSMRQIKAMLLDFSRAYEQFRLSLFDNDILSAAVEIDVARSLLAKDGLGGPGPFAATEIMELGED